MTDLGSSRTSSGRPYRDLSLWFDSLDGPVRPRTSLDGDMDLDVAIVGAGFTGLWTAYYLKKRDPSLRIAVVEREVAGYGASGRNGGWCSALFAQSPTKLASTYGREAEQAMRVAMFDTVDEVGKVAAAEGIDCHYRKGGTVTLVRSEAQLARARAEVAELAELGWTDTDFALVSAARATELTRCTGVLGATFTPHCAAIQPARLARGLAEVVERIGVRIFEKSPVTEIGPRKVVTAAGSVRAEVVVRATEGYSAGIPGSHRDVIPFYSLMVATEPLGAGVLDEIGLERGETFADHRHMVIYGQRTIDGRIAFGGRGAPYHFGSRVEQRFDRDAAMHRLIETTLVELYPRLRGVAITHRWGGPLGIARDWHPSVGLDTKGGFAWAGGYVGDGVGTSNLAGRTLAALICGDDDDCTRLCWVGHRSPAWEPEPLRWIGVNAGLKAMGLADLAERRSGRPSKIASTMARFLGG